MKLQSNDKKTQIPDSLHRMTENETHSTFLETMQEDAVHVLHIMHVGGFMPELEDSNSTILEKRSNMNNVKRIENEI